MRRSILIPRRKLFTLETEWPARGVCKYLTNLENVCRTVLKVNQLTMFSLFMSIKKKTSGAVEHFIPIIRCKISLRLFSTLK